MSIKDKLNVPAERQRYASDFRYPTSIAAEWLSDAGHAWLSVSNRDMATLGLVGISSFSYQNLNRSYLEEDCDAGIFFERLKEIGIEPKIKPTQPNWVERSFVRSLAPFNLHWVDNPLIKGSPVHIPSINQEAVMVGNQGSKIKFKTTEQIFLIPKSNPFRYIAPPLTTSTTNVKEYKCAFINLDQMTPDFASALPDIIKAESLLIRSMPDDAPNVVINICDTSAIVDDYPLDNALLNSLRDSGYQYVFVSTDF